jgi:hypothetical protein
MSIAIDPKGQRGIITPADKQLPEDQQTEWLIRDLNERQRVSYMDAVKLVDDGSGAAALGGQGSRVYTSLKGGLVGYTDEKPFRDSSGNVVPFEKNAQGRVSDEFLQRILWTEKVAISDEIVGSMLLDEEDTEK